MLKRYFIDIDMYINVLVFSFSTASAYHSLYSSASMRSPQQKSSPKTVSHKNTITKATTTIATTTTSSCSNSISRKTVTTPVVAGSTGVSLLSGKVKKSTGRPPKTDSSTKTNGSSVSSSHSSSRTSTVSQPVKSPLNLSTNKQVLLTIKTHQNIR